MTTLRCLAALLFLAAGLEAQMVPLDLFSDAPALSSDFVRIGAWNLRHLDVQGDADDFLVGADEEADRAILFATVAKAIEDLQLDLVAFTEVRGEDRVAAVCKRLNGGVGDAAPWKSLQTDVEFSFPGAELQFGLIWRSDRVDVDEEAVEVLLDQRQSDSLRAPWLVPLQAGELGIGMVLVHLKASQAFPQQDEVDALESFMRGRLVAGGGRHLLLCGDWNIRPDNPTGRRRLRQLEVRHEGRYLMRVLTVSELRPTLEEWEYLDVEYDDAPGDLNRSDLLAGSYVRSGTQNSLLDHLAISHTLSEVFDNPVEVTLRGSGATDLRLGIEIPHPMRPESDFRFITDHLPVVLTLRTTDPGPVTEIPAAPLEIVALLPNPAGSDYDLERVRLRNNTAARIDLDGWRLRDAAGGEWELAEEDGFVLAGGTWDVTRERRPMSLNNDGDTVILLDRAGAEVSRRTYAGPAGSGRWFDY